MDLYINSIISGKIEFLVLYLRKCGIVYFQSDTDRTVCRSSASKAVSAVAGVIGGLTHLYDSYFQQGILFIQNGGTSLSLYIDFECSGVIEMLAFLALLWFFPVYDKYERVVVSMIGVMAIFLANVLRIFFICLLVHIWGIDMYFFAHTIFARILFYGCTVFLYFYVFTKPQIVRQKVGAFRYDSN